MSAFLREERGSLTLLSLIFFLVMFMVGGLAVDMLVYENNRARLQNLSDRASLAATDLDSSIDPETLVQSYFEKEGLASYLKAVNVTSDHNGRSVQTIAAQPMKTMFMRMVGTTDLTAPAATTANESKNNIEVSLVLDNSGSMSTKDGSDGKTRLAKLQEATQIFVDTLFAGEINPEITVSVIPYSTQANAGDLIADRMLTTESHDYSYCFDFEDGDYDTVQMDLTATYQQTGHFDGFYQNNNPSYWTCRPEDSQEIYPLSSDPVEIMGRVNSLIATGQTSLHLGAKWGSALLDPSMNPVIRDILQSGNSDIDANNADRPFAYPDNRGQKVLILMTDGINTVHYEMAPQYVNGPSDMHLGRGALDKVLFNTPGLEVLVTPTDIVNWGLNLGEYDFYTRVLSEGNGTDVDGDGRRNEGFWVPETWVNGRKLFNAQFVQAVLGAGGGGKLKWADLFARMTPRYYAYEYIYKPRYDQAAYDAFMSSGFIQVNGTEKDTHLDAICTAAKDQGIIVYTVGVYSSDHTKAVLGSCATNENFFLNVAAGDDLGVAFKKIARNVVKLRMTQ